jgi:hypothetical protein
MAKSEFLKNLRRARSLFVHRVGVDSSRLDAEAIRRRLASAALWLTPGTIEGFDPDDFHDLPPQERESLTTAVDRFREIAESVVGHQPATDAQVLDGTAAFQEILTLLSRYMELDRESDSIRRIIVSLDLPPEVLTFEVEIGDDSTGDPALWLWIIVDDDVANDAEFPKLSANIQDRIRHALRKADIERWPYIRFRTANEQRAMLGTAAHESSS